MRPPFTYGNKIRIVRNYNKNLMMNACWNILVNIVEIHGNAIPTTMYVNYKIAGKFNPHTLRFLLKTGVFKNFKGKRRKKKTYLLDTIRLFEVMKILGSIEENYFDISIFNGSSE